MEAFMIIATQLLSQQKKVGKLWAAACVREGHPATSKFVAFSKKNTALNNATAKLQVLLAIHKSFDEAETAIHNNSSVGNIQFCKSLRLLLDSYKYAMKVAS
jgi:hypothetical protein